LSLGSLSAILLDQLIRGTPEPSSWLREWRLCGMMGTVPAVPAGFLLGTAILIRSTRRRLIVGAVFGLAVGAVWAVVWRFVGAPTIAAILFSGVTGGLLLTLLQTWIRGRGGWWTRWEA
ncbi:MAG: hypothetical protein K0Q72_965, partial [Armatimonadetes bacterium]|nr:hypothetical protein [Armatimonadota bacterium]